IWAAFVISRVKGVTRLSECSIGTRAPAYTRFAPLLKASSTSAFPRPRLVPVIKIVLPVMFIRFLLLLSYPLECGMTHGSLLASCNEIYSLGRERKNFSDLALFQVQMRSFYVVAL